MKPFIYVTRGQMPDEFEVKRRVWYRCKHAPDVIGLGFLSARGFSGDEFPQNCNVYEVSDLAIFDHPSYMDMRRSDEFVATVMGEFTYHSKTFYNQVVVTDHTGNEFSIFPSLSGNSLSLLYFECNDEDVAIEWFRTSVIKGDNEGVQTFRLWDQTHQHPLEPRKETRWCAVIEWTAAAMQEASRLESAAIALPGVKVARAENVAKWYGLLQECAFDPC